MKTKFSILLLAMFVALPSLLFSQNYPLQVILTPNDNFTSYLGELKENPGRYMGVRVINNSGREHNVFFHLKMERISPIGDISVYSNIDRKPAQGIPIRRGNNVIRMDQLSDNFSTHSFDDFEINGVQIDSPEDLIESLRAPEGVYKLCLIAYDYDVPPGSNPVMLSDPNFSCAQVKICYSASKIELLSPVNTMIAGNSSNVVIQPKRNLLVQWTQPSTTCGASMGNVDYELKFTDIYDGQTEEDALNYNPILLSLSYKNKTSVMLDTMQYQGIFNNGKRYAIGVTATASNQDIAILNDGKTTPASFIYGELPPNKGQQNTVKSKPSITNVPDCGNAVPDNKELIATLNVNDEIQVGDYKLKLSSISKNDDGSFKGEGIINLAGKPLFNGFPEIKAKVEFDKLQVNTGNQVIDGIVRTVYDDDKQKFFGGFGNDLSWDNNNLSKEDGEVLNENAKKIAQDFINSAMPKAEAEVNFPIKVESNGIEVAVSGMSFGAKGATFDMLYFMKIHEGDKLLAFGAKNICTNNNNVNDAKFYLLKDIKTKIEGLDFAIIGGDNNTYVDWNNQGFQGIKLSAKLSVPDSVIIAKDGKKIDNVDINTSFNSWSNWEAKIKIPDFKLAFCHDLSFDSLEARYVYNIDTTGIVFSNLNMKLPNYIKGLDNISVESASILSRGFNLNLVKKNILSIDKGSIGGWGFSIDNLEFNISDNIFKTSNIAGKIKIPFFENEIAYGGSPAAKDNALNLGITVKIGDNSSTKFLHYFNAEIAKTSKINIGNDGKIEAVLDGGVKVDEKSGCDFGFSATFSGFTIGTNYNDAEPKLDLKIGNWGTSTDSNNTWNGFGFQIKEFAFKDDTTGDNIELEFSVSADLQLGEGKFKIAGACKPIFKFDINKKTKEVSNPSFTLGSVMVAGEFSAVKLYGSLKRFSNHPIYGNGISGELSCGFPLGINVNSEVRFGSANGNVKYFYAGGAFRLSDEFAIPVGGVLGINGFGGAIWWNMKKTRDISSLSSMAAGSSSSDCGFNLVPVDKSTKTIGFAADVYFISLTGGSYLFNGKAGLNATFEGSNIGNLGVGGKIRVIGDGSDNDDRYVCHGELQMDFFFNNGKLNQFTLNAFANVDIMSGELQASLGINCDIQNEKYSFFLGKPIYSELRKCENKSDRAWCVSTGRDFNFIDASLMLQGYFCAGNISDNMPPLPKELVGLLSDGEINRPNSLNTGNRPGIMFGTRFSLDFNFDFGPIYASFYSVAGFDMEMKQSMGKGCKDGREIIGINGYYCRGQLYAYLSGKVGVSVKFFGKKIKADLCKVEAGALLRGGFPNPSWFKGSVAVRGEILGGLITFNTSARFTVGSECRDSEQVLDVVIIDEISPGFEKMQDAERQKKEEKPSIYNVNTITTHLPMNTPVVLYDLTGNTEDNLEYEFVFDEVTLRKVIDINSNRNPVVFLDTRELRGENRKSGKVFEIIPQEELEPFTMYQLTVTAKVLQNIDGKYQIPRGVKVSDTKQTKVVYFKTDDLPNFIHKDNIVACYPSHHQYELFRGLKDKWYITTSMSIGYLFNDRDKSLGEKAFLGALYDVQDDPERKKPKRFLYKYHPDGIKGIEGKNVITFSSMGSKNLEAEKIYEFRLFVVKTKQEATKYNKIQKEDIIAHEITEGGGDKASLGSKRDEYRGVDIDKNLGGIKTSEGKHTGKVYEAIRGEQDARTNPLDGILRGGMNKGSEIINQGSIANKGSQITNQGNIVGGLSQGSVAGGVGIGNQAINQGQVTTYSNTGGTTTKSKAMPAIPSGSNMSSNVASNGKVKEPAGTVSTISKIGTNNVGHINQIHYNTKNVIMKEHVDDTKTTYQDYKDVTSNTKLKYIGASNNVNDEVMSSAFVNKVNEYLDDSELEDIYQNAEIHQIYSNYFRVSGFLDPEQKFKTTLTNDVINLDDVPRSGFIWATKTKSYLDGQESKGMKEKLTSYPGDDFIAHYLPYHTTVEEMFGGKTINGSRAADLPSRILSVPELFSAEYSAMNYLWQNYFFDFFRIIRSASTHFKLPYFDNNILPSDLSGMDNCVYYYNDPRYTSRREKFHGPLTDDEIATGSVRRSSNITRLTYQCHHAQFLALCMGYCLNLGYQIWDQDWFKRKDKSGKINSISVTDYLNSYYPDEDRGGYIVLDKEKYYDNRVLTQLMHDFDISYFGVPSQYNQEGTSYDRWYDNNYKRVKRASNKSCFLLPLNFYSLALHFDGCDECKEVKGHIPGSRAIKCLYEIGRAVYPEYHRVNNYFIEPVFNNRIEVNSCIRRNSSSVVEIDQLLY